ncbi:uncharacterized protein [Oscarella lobularis]|uniref:uncharacterized protein n=1 Tax=Oscarella lobularis TaxID=121494 RepID=UPI0033143612
MKLLPLLLSILTAARCISAQTTTFHLSPNGNDSNTGSADQPWKSLSRSLQGIRDLKKAHGGTLHGPVDVIFQAGMYDANNDATVTFDASVSGGETTPITFQSASADAKANIVGGKVVSGWKQSGGVWTTTLPEGTKPFYQLWVDGERREMAHTPMMHYVKIGERNEGVQFSYPLNNKRPQQPYLVDDFIVFQPGQVKSDYHDVQAIQAVVYHSWTASVHQVKAIYSNNNTIYLQNPTTSQFTGAASGNRFYLQNIYEMLQPGTFYYDRTSHMLTYHSYPNEDLTKMPVVIPTITQILTSNGNATSGNYVQYINFMNINFMYSAVDTSVCFAGRCDDQSASFLTTATINLQCARYWTLDGVTLAHTGGYALWINGGSSYVTVNNSHVYDSAAGGIRVAQAVHGVVSDANQMTSQITITNSILEDGGHFYQMGCGILLQESGNNTLTHNLIHDFNYTGISIGWTWGYADTSTYSNYLGFNEIYNIGKGVLSDMGCIYSLGKQAGSMLDNNLCYSVVSYNYGGWGWYTDEGSSNITIQNNIAYHTKSAGIHQHYGENNLFQNNVIAFPHHVSCAGEGGCLEVAVRSSQHPPGRDQGSFSSFTFMRNIVYIQNGTALGTTMPTGFQNMTVDSNVYWSTTDKGNITFPPTQKPVTFQQWQAEGKDQHSMLTDPKFTDPESFDFTKLSPDSPALKLGFKPISMDQVGPQGPKSEKLAAEKRIGWVY